ncbi:MAG: FtsX-like permease family protein [Chlorobi bacterium]|nr:FtsX-like permease family protein [Chlorobiota bacterium]
MRAVKLIIESIVFASRALVINKVRTILSLLGITIGIFSIISVFTVFDSLEKEIKDEINSLGSNVLFIQKWPWMMGGSNYPWWKYINRPEPKMSEMHELLKRSNTLENATLLFRVSRTAYYRNNSMENIPVLAVSQDYNKVMKFDLQEGRYFTPTESKGGKNICIIGANVSKELFQGVDPIGKKIKLFGRKLQIIGVLKKEGKSVFGNPRDNYVLIPVNYALGMIDARNIGTTIIVKAKPGISNDQMRDEITGIMRSIRKLSPREEDNFAINETDIITKGFSQLFAVIATVGWIIGGFSLLVGGFGIANIMFVSVKERTNQIGIQKSLGAKRYFILFEFLFEAIFLSVIGGVIGLIIVYILTYFGESLVSFKLILSFWNIVLGLTVSAFIGLISGFIPSWNASRLNPVDAMRSNF